MRLPPHDMNDAGLCYHGDLMNCNRQVTTHPGGCSWWHFYPTETKQDFLRIYNKIVGGELTYQNTNRRLFFADGDILY